MSYNKKKLEDARSNPESIVGFIENNDWDFCQYIDEVMKKKENANLKGNNYELIIYSIGFSPYTTIHSLYTLKPQKAIFLYTPESKKFAVVFNSFAKRFLPQLNIEESEISNNSSVEETYNIIENFLRENKGKRTAIDITGGKKPIIASSFMGASQHRENQVDTIYLDFYEYENDRPIYGSEYLSILVNPNDLFSTMERSALKKLFDSGHFKRARELSKDLIQRISRIPKTYIHLDIDSQLRELERIRYFSKLYEARNEFNYNDIDIKNEMLSTKEVEGLMKLKQIHRRIKNTLDTRSEEVLTDYSIYDEFKDDVDLLLYYVLERYNGAIRYKKIDLGIYLLRLVSTVELTGTIAVKGEGNNKSKKSKGIELAEKINRIKDPNLRKTLNKLRYERNHSSLIHGFGSISQPKENYENAVVQYIRITFDKSQPEIDSIKKSIAFRSFLEVISNEKN